jgi:hypothetical protein
MLMLLSQHGLQDVRADAESVQRRKQKQNLVAKLNRGVRCFRYSVYLLYWYKSTNSDAATCRVASAPLSGTQFTSFLGTKVQILTQKALASTAAGDGLGEVLLDALGCRLRAAGWLSNGSKVISKVV